MNIKFLALNLLIVSSYTMANDFNQAQTQLHQAILNNSGEQVKQALIYGITQEQKTEPAEWLLIKAILREDVKEIEQRIKQLISEGKNGNSPVIWAALLKKPNAVNILLECGAQLDANIVKYAIRVGDLKTALIIIKSGMDISAIIQECMQLCIERANINDIDATLQLIQELIKRGYNVNNAWKCNDCLFSIYDGKILKLFIENGANPNQIIEGHRSGETPFLIAIQYSSKLAIEILLNAGADVNQAGTVRGYNIPITPLFLAVTKSNIEGVKLLLDRGANIQQAVKINVNDKALTPLAFAIEKGNSAMVELLLEHGAQY